MFHSAFIAKRYLSLILLFLSQYTDADWSSKYKAAEGGEGRWPCTNPEFNKTKCEHGMGADGQANFAPVERLWFEEPRLCESCRVVEMKSFLGGGPKRKVVDCLNGAD